MTGWQFQQLDHIQIISTFTPGNRGNQPSLNSLQSKCSSDAKH